MKIFVELERLRNPYSGLGQFAQHLAQALIKNNIDNELTYFLPNNYKEEFGADVTRIFQNTLHKFLPPSDKYNIWHCTHQDSTYFHNNSKNSKLIFTIHDLNFLVKYQNEPSKLKSKIKYLQQKIDSCSGITFISQYTKLLFLETIKLNKPVEMEVIKNGNTLVIYPNATKPAFLNNEKPYFFSIGVFEAKKNFKALIPIIKHFKEYQFVLAGNINTTYGKEFLAMAKTANLLSQLVTPGTITEQDKYWLYRNCEGFLFPSIAEGFGLPVVEAMSLGKPLFISHAASLPEIGGSCANYFYSFEADHMISVINDGILSFKNDTTIKGKLIQQAALYNWDEIGKQYIQFYEKINKI
jgi:glycosyltransferase involved in cell wall biosynthesis